MKNKKLILLFLIAALTLLIIVSITAALTATNFVPGTHLMDQAYAITANALKPPECASLNLTNVVTGSGVIQGTSGNDLILGTSGDDALQGKQGDDCLVGGGGVDDFKGQNGSDICIGSDNDDTYKQCETEYH